MQALRLLGPLLKDVQYAEGAYAKVVDNRWKGLQLEINPPSPMSH